MNDYDYIVTIDENGSPCLQHALFGGRNAKGSQRQNHKYYARAQDKGRWRYFYSPEEFRAWSSGATQKVKQAVNNAKKTAGDAAGEVRKSINARKELNEANKATGFGSGLKQWNAQRKYNQTAMGKAEKAVRGAVDDIGDRARGIANQASGKARQTYDEARNAVGKNAAEAVGSARKKIKDLTGAAEKYGSKALSELREAASGAKNKAKEAANKVGDKLGIDEREDLKNANFLNRVGRQQLYDDTPMGKAEKAAKKVRDAANSAADRVKDTADRASSAAGSVADKASDIRDSIRNLADSAGSAARGAADRAKNAASNAASSARNAVDNATGTTAKKEMDAAGQRAMMGLDDSIGAFVDAQNRYNNSARGKTDSAKSNAEAAFKAAQSKAKKALAKAMDYLPDEQIEAIKDLIRGK